MKIALLHLGRKGSGPIFSIEMAKALTLEGHQVISFISSFAENRVQWEASGLKVVFIKTYNTKIQFLLSLFCFNRFYKVISKIYIEKPDAIYSPMGHTWDMFLMPLLKKFTRVKTIHDVELHEGENSYLQKFLSYFNYRSAEGFVVLSSKYVATLVSKKILHRKIVVIPHAGFDYYLNDHNKFEYKKVVLFFGRIIRYKGLEVLLKAMKLVIENDPSVKLRIVGNGDITTYRNLINEIGDSVELYNRWINDDEVSSFVCDVQIVVLPYTHASQSGVIPLAYSFSKPVISTNVGCLSEQIIDGKTGFIVEPNDISALAEKILYMLNHQDETIKMGIQANEYAKRELTWKSSAIKLVNFIEEIKG
jgi:glycosyltransferase involved in cell wall biosynthesis